MESDLPIGRRLKEIRLRKGLSVRALSRLVGEVSPSTISNWENGRSDPQPHLLGLVADALEVDPGLKIEMIAALRSPSAWRTLSKTDSSFLDAGPMLLTGLRLRMHISQPKLAQKLGVSQGTIAKWESGRSIPSSDSLQRLLSFYGVEKEELTVLRQSDYRPLIELQDPSTRLPDFERLLPDDQMTCRQKLAWIYLASRSLWPRSLSDPNARYMLSRLFESGAWHSFWIGSTAESLRFGELALKLSAGERKSGFHSSVGTLTAQMRVLEKVESPSVAASRLMKFCNDLPHTARFYPMCVVGGLLGKAGKYSLAEPILSWCLKNADSYPENMTTLIFCLMKGRKYKEALNSSSHNFGLDGDLSQRRVALFCYFAEAAAGLGAYHEAQDWFDAAQRDIQCLDQHDDPYEVKALYERNLLPVISILQARADSKYRRPRMP